jgi:DNA-binding NarL/FixJ family response regulator
MKILLADDHALIRAGLRNELAELDAAVEFVEAWDAESLRQAFARHGDLDLALVDLAMPGMDGAQTISALCRDQPMVPLIVVSGANPSADAPAVMRAGAAGFIPKSALPKVMLQAIRLVLAGGQYLPPESMGRLNADSRPSTDRAMPPSLAGEPGGTTGRDHLHLLSKRQREVFDLLAKGLSNKMIARQLDLTEGTVKNHVATIFDVLGVHNRLSAVLVSRKIPGNTDDSD